MLERDSPQGTKDTDRTADRMHARVCVCVCACIHVDTIQMRVVGRYYAIHPPTPVPD